MDWFANCKLFWLILLLTIVGEFFVPWFLKTRYPGYDSRKTVMSVLGSPSSPVRKFYNAWLIWLGCYLSLTAFVLFDAAKGVSVVLASLIFISVFVFAIGAGLLSGLFSVNETRGQMTTASKIHGVGAAIGFMALLFFPLLSGILAFQQGNSAAGFVHIGSFVLAFLFFIVFIMGDKEPFQDTVVSYEGLWERLSLMAMYVPFAYMALEGLLSQRS